MASAGRGAGGDGERRHAPHTAQEPSLLLDSLPFVHLPDASTYEYEVEGVFLPTHTRLQQNGNKATG